MEESNSPTGKLYLIPSLMGEIEPLEVLPLSVKKVIDLCDHYIVENEKSARAFIKRVLPSKHQPDLVLYTTNKFSDPADYPSYLEAARNGEHIGLISEAGAPGIADPGAEIISLAHNEGIRVVPLVGPSSIFMAMMASGMNGQSFAFNGYLPIDNQERKKQIKNLENLSRKTGQSQIFMETPYRNDKLMKDLISICHPDTRLCVAREVTTLEEYIRTQPISWWKNNLPELEKRPAIFILSVE
tara:strand:+ start:1539 stop:2264 length:726 start_codon:yes stop_codon:yes gene_type:complete